MLNRLIFKNLIQKKSLLFQFKQYSKCLTVKEVYGLNDLPAELVCVKGWIKNKRVLKDVVFVDIIDGSNLSSLQVVMSPSLNSSKLSFGSSVEIHGILERNPKGTDLKVYRLNIIGSCDSKAYPIKMKQKHTLEYLRALPHLKFRTATHSSLLRVNDVAHHSFHDYFHNNNFVHVPVPMLTTNDCEGAGEVFKVESLKKIKGNQENQEGFFGAPTFLTVSGQLHLEAVAGALRKVYTFGPTFRADSSQTRHHLAEFRMVEAEMAFVDSLADVTEVIESLLKKVASDVMLKCSEEVEFLSKNNGKPSHKDAIENIISKKFICISYDEAIDILLESEKDFMNKVSWGVDLHKEHERHIVDHFESTPVFVTNYPSEIKPFYAKSNEDGTVESVDLLFPDVGEVCGGSLREHRLEVLLEKLKGKDIKSLEWYLDLQRYGPTPHGGFGIGYERFIQMLLGFENIRDVATFPRMYDSCAL